MYSASAHLYDVIYTRMKSYEEEASKVAALLRREGVPARPRVLDVACGTGEHGRFLQQEADVDGIDLNPEFLDIARGKNPSGTYALADMIDFDLGRKYDAVLCLFSSIGYVVTLDNLRKALASFARHLQPDGVVLVEPWFTPDRYTPGHLHMQIVDDPELKICRMNVSEMSGRISSFKFHYLVGTPDGVQHFTEQHALGLFTVEEMLGAFADAGLRAEYDPQGIYGRGLYVARRAP